MIDCFYVFLFRRLERRFDLFHCTGSSKRNSTADESCVFVVGKTSFFLLNLKLIHCHVREIEGVKYERPGSKYIHDSPTSVYLIGGVEIIALKSKRRQIYFLSDV